MNKNIKRHLEAFQREVRFVGEHPLTPANPRAAALVVILNSVITNMQGAVSSQVLGRGEFLGGTDDRRRLAKDLRGAVREISGTASVLDPDLYPGAEEQFAMPLSQSYEALLGAARGFVTAIGPIKSAFVDRGLPADFDEQLADKVATFEDATSRKHDGRQEQKTGTVTLNLETSRGMVATTLAAARRHPAGRVRLPGTIFDPQRRALRGSRGADPGQSAGGGTATSSA